MGEKNKVNVKIYGQEYTIAGDKPREHIIKVADYVDNKMNQIAKALPTGSASSLAVLTAINSADEYFSAMDRISTLQSQNEQLVTDSEHYEQLWEEAKKSFIQYKEDAQTNNEQKEELLKLLSEKAEEFDSLMAQYKELEEKYNRLQEKNQGLENQIRSQQESNKSDNTALKELESKCKEMENSFFDLQMENIKLKGDLERYKKNVD
ncbi:MAG: cell division protein ZapA [Anaerovoracaceae bacterium]